MLLKQYRTIEQMCSDAHSITLIVQLSVELIIEVVYTVCVIDCLLSPRGQ